MLSVVESFVGIKTSDCLLERCVEVWDQKFCTFFRAFMVVRILECLCKSSVGIRVSELFSKFLVGINFCSF